MPNPKTNPYTNNDFKNRTDYLNSLKEDYPSNAVDLLSDILGPNEDFDGLVTDLRDYQELGMLEGLEEWFI